MTFKLEIGKRHVTRGGEITDVVKLDTFSGMLYTGEFFSGSAARWYPTGVSLLNVLSPRDLVAVHEEPQYYWLNVYPHHETIVHIDGHTAKIMCDKQRDGKTLKLKVVKGNE